MSPANALDYAYVLGKVWMAADRHGSIGKDVMLMVSDGQGEPYSVLKPFKLTAAGWVNSGKGTPRLPSRPYSGSYTFPARRNGDALQLACPASC